MAVNISAFVGSRIIGDHRGDSRIGGAGGDAIAAIAGRIWSVGTAGYLAAETIEANIDGVAQVGHLDGAVVDVVTGIANHVAGLGVCCMGANLPGGHGIGRSRFTDQAVIAAKNRCSGRISVAAAAGCLKAGIMLVTGSADRLGCRMGQAATIVGRVEVMKLVRTMADLANTAGNGVPVFVITHAGGIEKCHIY